MWRLMMFLLCLIAALSGTPLRQAEAANDLARSLAESGQGDAIEPIDGGVGDDKEASILKTGDDTHSLSATILPVTAAPSFILPIPASSLPNIGDRRLARVTVVPSRRHDRRFVLLQCFLF